MMLKVETWSPELFGKAVNVLKLDALVSVDGVKRMNRSSHMQTLST